MATRASGAGAGSTLETRSLRRYRCSNGLVQRKPLTAAKVGSHGARFSPESRSDGRLLGGAAGIHAAGEL